MKPVLFQIGRFPVSSFGVFLLLAFVIGILLLRARTTRLGWDVGEVLDLSLYAIIGGVIGARIGYVLVNWRDFAADPVRVLTIWRDAGLVFYGALIGGGIVAWLYGRRRGWSLGQIADAASPGLALGYGIAMIGTLLYGLNYGRPAVLPWSVHLFGEPRHPTQMYLLVAAVAICGILVWREKRPHTPGRLFWEFVVLYALARVVVEVFMDSPRVLDSLTLAQAVNILAAVLAGIVWVILGRRLPAPSPGAPITSSPPVGSPGDTSSRPGSMGPEVVGPRD
jgi:phosphatidylglycerol---prolipoprotein diacylglyceryl transferase